jgi:MFS family permease
MLACVISHNCSAFAAWFHTVSVGRLGDIIGRKPLLTARAFLFTAASALCGRASTLWLLIADRAAQGLGAAGSRLGICR